MWENSWERVREQTNIPQGSHINIEGMNKVKESIIDYFLSNSELGFNETIQGDEVRR